MIRALSLTLLLLLSGCIMEPSRMSLSSAVAAHIDHVIVGTPDLGLGIAELEQRTGVRPIIGGAHPGRGTRNALMSLGDGTYLELLAPDPAQSIENNEIRELRGLRAITPIGWAVSGMGEADLRSALASGGIAITPSTPGSRRRPDGSILRWNTFSYATIDHPLAPFFIIWADPAFHPSRTSPSGCRLLKLRLNAPPESRIEPALAPLGLDLEIVNSQRPLMRLELECPKGHVGL